MRVVFAPEAKEEFVEAERYYEQQLPGLERRFREEVRAALRRIRRWPLAYPIDRGEVRRVILTRFPYKVLYSIRTRSSLRARDSPPASQTVLLGWVGRSKPPNY
jgi:plasmid stabilization system protein ParE